MNKPKFSEVTVVFPSYNEGVSLVGAIEVYRRVGISNFLVIDDNSKDDTYDKARGAGAELIVHKSSPKGFLITALDGIYSVKTKYAVLVGDAGNIAGTAELFDFISFGIRGNYGMLISEGSKRNRKITKLLMNRFGIFLPNPGFEIIMMNAAMLTACKKSATFGGVRLYLDLIKTAVNEKVKIGVYPIKVDYAYPVYKPSLITRWMMEHHQYPGEAVNSYNNYFKYAFPDIDKKQYSYNYRVAIIGAVVGAVCVAIITISLSISLYYLGIK